MVERQRMTIKMKCLKCGYEYSVVLFSRYPHERCPACGHGDTFNTFEEGASMTTK